MRRIEDYGDNVSERPTPRGTKARKKKKKKKKKV